MLNAGRQQRSLSDRGSLHHLRLLPPRLHALLRLRAPSCLTACVMCIESTACSDVCTFTLPSPHSGSRHGRKLTFDPSVLCCVCYDPHAPCDFTCQVEGCSAGYHHGCLRGNPGWYTPLHRRELVIHKNTHFANTFVCPHCVFATVMGLPADPDNEVRVHASGARSTSVCLPGSCRQHHQQLALHHTRRLYRTNWHQSPDSERHRSQRDLRMLPSAPLWPRQPLATPR
jgi:hypothetical protein